MLRKLFPISKEDFPIFRENLPILRESSLILYCIVGCPVLKENKLIIHVEGEFPYAQGKSLYVEG